jgi:hypothetical protein
MAPRLSPPGLRRGRVPARERWEDLMELGQLVDEAIRLALAAEVEASPSERRALEQWALAKLREVARRRSVQP